MLETKYKTFVIFNDRVYFHMMSADSSWCIFFFFFIEDVFLFNLLQKI